MPQNFAQWADLLIPTKADAMMIGFFSFLTALVQAFLGGFDAPIQALAIVCLIDYVSGTAAALKLRKWSSSVGFKGLAKKASIFMVVGFCHWVDVGMSVDILRTGAICAYVINEAGSVLENVDKLGMGYLIPLWLRNRLADIKEREQERSRHVHPDHP